MTRKLLLGLGVLAMSGFSIASAKTYDIVLSNTTQVGSVKLNAGEYHLKVEGNNAVFTDVNSAKSFTTPVKVENTEKKFDQTSIESKNQAGVDQVQEIDLAGAKMKLQFD
ncbi:MAG TPA: hypothetical protein VG675_14905 [Bryobacteraceae bacterium]|nr:hypothetical protein [Bryobacteraceae bacterium]